MGLLSSLFSRSPAREASADADSVDNVAQARTRARQRLMGAVVLVGIGIIGFPLLFETQPRPIAVDVPIEIPRKETAAPLSLPTARAPTAKAAASPPADAERPPERVAKATPPMITETAAEAGLPASRPAVATAPAKAAVRPDDKPAADAKPEPKAEPRPPARPDPKPEVKPEPKTEVKAEPKAAAKPPAADAARAQALLDGKAAAAAPAGSARFIVQIGAFADPVLARQTRLKVERLGLVTYTHVAKTPDGERTRVRVGPVATRDEAEKMAAKIKAAGLAAAILTL